MFAFFLGLGGYPPQEMLRIENVNQKIYILGVCFLFNWPDMAIFRCFMSVNFSLITLTKIWPQVVAVLLKFRITF